MRTVVRGIVMGLLASGACMSAYATQWTTGLRVTTVQVLPDGGFWVYLAGFSDSACSTNPTGIRISANALGVTTDAVKAMLAAALSAKASGLKLAILYDDSGSVSPGSCYGQHVAFEG